MKMMFLVLLSAFAVSAVAQVETFKIDPSHTSIVFKVNHLGFTDVYGMFTKVDGELKFDEKTPANNSLVVNLDANSINTNEAKRDKHLKTADFFDAKQFSKITFKSDSIKKASGSNYDVKGQLTMHGVTKPVAFTFKRSRTGKDPWGNTRSGGTAEFKVKRSDFGMNFMQGENQVGDEVTVMLGAEGIKQ